MAEYIEREKLEEAFDNADPDVCESYAYGNSYWGFGRENVRDVIRSVPAADVAPVVHGRWGEYPRAHYFKCSECRYTVPYRKAVSINGRREYNYCPHCGARMDGDAERRNT